MPDDADAVAIEHVIWAAGEGLRPVDVLAAIGVFWAPAAPTWDDVQLALRIAWRRLREIERARPDPRQAALRLVWSA